MKRNKHSLSHYRLLTCDMGELVPVSCVEVLPGDTIQHGTSLLLRVSPLLAPVMHPVSVRVHHWFVPFRLLWADWENFITGGSDGLGNGAVYPTITAGGGGFTAGQLPDYFGIPPGVASLNVSALPFRAYAKIFNEFYRDEDLVTALPLATTGGNDTITGAGAVSKVAWEKDYFTAARPWSQKGPEISLPLGTSAPVKGLGTPAQTFDQPNISVYETGGGNPTYANSRLVGDASANRYLYAQGTAATGGYPNIYADLTAATGATVNDLREALALQRYQEARARYGSRYTEYLAYLGVRSSDARLQRPEYLGGGKQTISFGEVLQTGVTTSGTPNIGVAEMKGHGIAAMRSRRYRRFFEEHGYIVSLLSVRPRTMYVNGQHRMWNRRTKEDHWQKELEHIGMQEIPRREVYAEAGAGGDTLFGFQDRYADYRHLPSLVAGDFRTSTLNFWHLGRIFASAPALNSSFVTCDPSKRINAVQTNDVLWIMANNSIQARRMVSRNAEGRIE